MTALGFHLELVLDDGRDGRQHLDQLAGVVGGEVVEMDFYVVAASAFGVVDVVSGQRRRDVIQGDLRPLGDVFFALDEQFESHYRPPFNVVRTSLWRSPNWSGTARNAASL